MSHSADLDVTYAPGELSPSIIIRALLAQGWSANDHGLIHYSCPGVEDWNDAALERLEAVLEEMDDTWEKKGEQVAITLLWGDSESGGAFLLGEKEGLSFLPNVNRRTLARAAGFTDTSWYAERILGVLQSLGQVIETVKWREHV